MTDPISNFNRVAQLDASARQNAKVEADKAAAKEAATPKTGDARRASAGSDEVRLSEAAQQAMKEPAFDKEKVDAIRKALQDGQYPLDSRRIANSFVALEKMIKG
ncbi:MAG: flagellar biosynthesis anti-sigma factor FlgM [Betaproteobacteria bacterium]|jgi:negative regulator of flagellin synthesis FlgM|nr:flagellar biosynthesis anti-sigma factor FlgM [Betaproteobacteria bacterium]NBS47948.1 flagellar biosynthesis anti-sigma factor FlgM [Betaproteobacteria bacterium]